MLPLTGLKFLLGLLTTNISRLWRWASALENFPPVITQKFRVWLGQLVRQTNWSAFKLNKVLLQRWLWKESPKLFAQHNAQFVIKRDESGIKRGVVKRRKAKSVARIQPVIRKFAPRFDVAVGSRAAVWAGSGWRGSRWRQERFS